MFKNKTVKLFLMLSVIFLSFFFIGGCSNEKVYEKENKEIVDFPISYYTIALSSIPGQPILLTLEDATFICRIEKGSFKYYDEKKEYKIGSGETIFYCPCYEKQDSYITVEENAYVDITILIQEKIVGYSVVEISYDGSWTWSAKLIASNLFINEKGECIDVSEDYVNTRIARQHK